VKYKSELLKNYLLLHGNVTNSYKNRLRHPWLMRIFEEARNRPAPNKRGPRSSLGILWLLGFRFARITLAPLNHIALASEPADILDAGSLHRLGQRRRPATVSCKFWPLHLLRHARASGRRAQLLVKFITNN
jgi:hypothetical protein